MTRKLTLSLDSDIIDFAHKFSKNSKKSISRIVENYFLELKEQKVTDMPKDLEEIYGIFEGVPAPDKKELRKMFHEKNSD